MIEAINSSGARVQIRNADKDESYECEHCGDDVRPVQGRRLPWHYRHATNRDCIGTAANPAGVGD